MVRDILFHHLDGETLRLSIVPTLQPSRLDVGG
jgi:hypothetical protein